MNNYDADDRVTVYFIVYNEFGEKIIRAWSDNKDYAKAYMDFHKCKNYKMKSLTDTWRNVVNIVNENINDEIELVNINVKNDKKHKLGQECKLMVVPITTTERILINDESVTFMATRVDYSFIEEAFYYLKDKHQKALKSIYLKNVMDKVIHEKQSKFTDYVQMDELKVLFRSFPEHFGV